MKGQRGAQMILHLILLPRLVVVVVIGSPQVCVFALIVVAL